MVFKDAKHSSIAADEADGGEKEGQDGAASVVATGAAEDPLVVAAVRNAPAILGAYTDLPPPEELRALLSRLFAAEGLHLYVH